MRHRKRVKCTVVFWKKVAKFVKIKTHFMKRELILYENHELHLESVQCFLDHHQFTNMFDFKGTVQFEAIETLVSKQSELLIMNISEINVNEVFEQIENLLSLHPALKIVLLSSKTDVRLIKKFFDKGVRSFLTENTDGKEFLRALGQVINDKVYINDDTKNALFNFICNVDEKPGKKFGIEELTEREKEVLDLICEGFRTKEIAEKLFISTHTVESHRRNIMLKLDVRNSSMLVKFAVDHNLVS